MAYPSSDNISAVRFLVGDPDEGAGTLLGDAEIQFALDQATDDVYAAAAICARALGARYARRVDTRFETIDTKYSQLVENYAKLARSLDKQSSTYGSRGVGIPQAGGISVSDDSTARDNTDRVKPYFTDNMFGNPPSPVTRYDDE